MDSSLSLALSLAARALPVLALRPGAKTPATSHGVKDATTDPAQIRAMFRTVPWAPEERGVGLACGGDARVVALDLDLDPAKGLDGRAELERSPLAGALPATATQRTPRGGTHLLFRWPGDAPLPRNRVGLLPGVDLRSDGGYVKVYDNALATADFAEAPAALVEFATGKKAPAKPAAAPPPPWAPHVSQHPDSRAPSRVLERARGYLACCGAAVQGQGGHSALLWAAHALVVGFDLPDADALRLLWEDFNPRCVPPWDPSDAAQRRDFERKVSEARRNPGKHSFGYLLADSDSGANADDLAATGAPIARALLSSAELSNGQTVTRSNGLTVEPSDSQTVGPSDCQTARPPDPGDAWPADLLEPPGLVGEIARWITATAGCPQPVLSLAAALACMGAVLGRKVRSSGGLRTNLYCLAVAPSGGGKDHPCKCVQALLREAGADALLAGAPTSDAAIEKMLSDGPCRLLVLDEAGKYFEGTKRIVSGTNYAATVTGALTSLFTSANGLYIGKQKSDGEPVRIDQPCLSILGATAPDVLYGAISRAEVRDGFLARMLVFAAPTRPRRRRVREAPPPARLVEAVARWARYEPPAPDGTGDIAAASTCHPRVMEPDGAAARVLDECEASAAELNERCEAAEDPAAYLWARCGEMAERIALVVAAGCDDDAIGEDAARYGSALARRLCEGFAALVTRHVAEDPRDTPKLRVLETIRRAGAAGVPKGLLLRRHRSFSARRLGDLLDDLVESGDVEAASESVHNHPRTLYRLRSPEA